MTTLQVNSLRLACDGCGQQLNDGALFTSAMDARGAAYGQGWRFPHMVGKKTGALIVSTSDVCPPCLPGWKPQARGERHAGYQRQDGTTR